MYRAKSRGRAHYELFNKTMHTSAIEKLQLETDLRHAIDRGDLLLLYQPIVSLTNGGLPACEALIRWRHPTRGMILPEQFIEVAEDSGLINPITRWVLRTACNQQLAWREAGLPTIRISVNISPQQLIRQEVRSLVIEALEESGIEPSALQIELTESAFMECSEPTLGPLRDLFERGVQVALDDFGTGYSSLVYLRRIPLNFIKIDQNFIRAIPESADDAAITSGLIALAHSLHLKVIAEGVETPEQLAFLAAQGCDAAQGFAISRPVSADQFEALIRTGIDLSTLLEEAALSAD
jgi:EAL domain-containing protein (putative c-di-GMP-specific phosphodiesterase class I)